MKILLSVHHPLDPNQGASGVTVALGNGFKAMGCDVEFFSFDDAFSKPERYPYERELKYPWKLHEFLSRHAHDFDVIDASSGDSWVWATFGRPNAKKRHALVTRSHGLEHTMDANIRRDAAADGNKLSRKYLLYGGGFRLWEVARSFQKADMSLMLNRRDQDFIIEKLNVAREKTRLIENGVPSSFVGLPFHSAETTHESPIKIASVASYELRKGVVFLFQAMNKVLARHKNVSITFFGTGCPQENILRDYDPGVHAQIEVMQHFDRIQLPDLLKDYQIFVFPSLWEGFSLALVEAMACGLAPVATAIPGNVEIAHDAVNSILVPPRNSEALENAIERLITDPDLLDRLRKSAYDSAQAYDWNGIVKKTLSIYEETIIKRGA